MKLKQLEGLLGTLQQFSHPKIELEQYPTGPHIASRLLYTWKSNINIVLVSENNRFVLTEECPSVPPANVTRVVRELYDRWIASNNKAKAYMLVSMSDALRSKMEPKECTFEIMESL
ncbi:hypothetical protein ZIOFF_039295 [Zingiber officinale]|uniref:Uncharacterized protein n=1 Tax=Zingiber officinale TaxID=94328 RepID=A0A8J5G497_ZINOF|nr:hypothetical protein ZIOFF_039295 [Zingiber officinale]